MADKAMEFTSLSKVLIVTEQIFLAIIGVLFVMAINRRFRR
jgi:hypothetical protein